MSLKFNVLLELSDMGINVGTEREEVVGLYHLLLKSSKHSLAG